MEDERKDRKERKNARLFQIDRMVKRAWMERRKGYEPYGKAGATLLRDDDGHVA